MASGLLPDVVPLTVEQFHRMIEAGILREGEPVELVEGLILRKDRRDSGDPPMAHGIRHRSALTLFLDLAQRFAALDCWLQGQAPVRLSETSEPEPDIAVVNGSHRDYFDRHPGPADVLAVVEVADTSLPYDVGRKKELYAAASVPTYVVVDLKGDRVLVFEEPDATSRRYGRTVEYAGSDVFTLTLGTRGSIVIAVSELLPPRR